MKTLILVLIFWIPFSLFAAPCSLTILSQSQFDSRVYSLPEIRDFSQTANHILKKSFDTAEKVDDATLGLVSAVTTSQGLPFELLRPEVWDRLSFKGSVVYEDSPFTRTFLKGAKLSLSDGSSNRTSTTGTQGEFAESLSKLVPYSKLRLLPAPFFYKNHRSVPTVKVPLTVVVESPLCVAEAHLDEIPLEPLLLIVAPTEAKKE